MITATVLLVAVNFAAFFWTFPVHGKQGSTNENVAVESRSVKFGDFVDVFSAGKSPKELATLTIKTRDMTMAAATGSVHFILYDIYGNKSKEIELPRGFFQKVLSTYFVNPFTFSANSSKRFPISEANNLGKLQSIEVWHTPPKFITYNRQWKPQLITIVQKKKKNVSYFPMDRWLHEQVHYFYEKYDAVLPQNDRHPRQRLVEIHNNRKLYRYTAFVDGANPLVKDIPPDEPFTSNYTYTAIKDVTVAGAVKFFKQQLSFTQDWKSFKDFKTAYTPPFRKPKYFDIDFRSDEWFGRQRLQGINPTLIRLTNTIPKKLNVSDENVGGLLGNYTLSEALACNRIFICDLEILKDLKNKFKLKIPAPIALFFLNDSNILMPISIQLMQKKGPKNPVFTPEDERNVWQLAKFYYNLGEASHHENIMHFAMTHAVTEGMIACTYRQLSQSHPVFRLLKPHFLFTIPINHLALAILINPGGLIENASNMKSKSWLYYTGLSIATMNWTEYGNQHVDFAKRRVTKNILKDYPYRDDVLDVYNLTRKYVKRVLKIYYRKRKDLLNDNEIQNWRIEMSRSSRRLRGLNLKGVPGDDTVGFTKLSQLIDTVTIIIHTASARHATVNFMQYDWYGYPPNYPLYLKGPIPTSKKSISDKQLLGYLSKRNQFLDCLTLMHMLSMRTTNNLGNFEVPLLYHPKAKAAYKKFRGDIDKTSAKIRRRNKKRKFPYIWADPQLIPNAASI